MKSLETISNEIAILEAERDFGDITEEGLEMLAVLNFCYDLLTRTQIAQSIQVPQPEEMKEPGFEDETINKYGTTTSELANFTFSLVTSKGEISLRKLFSEILNHAKFAPKKIVATDITAGTGVSGNSISIFRNEKGAMRTDIYEKIVNFIILKR